MVLPMFPAVHARAVSWETEGDVHGRRVRHGVQRRNPGANKNAVVRIGCAGRDGNGERTNPETDAVFGAGVVAGDAEREAAVGTRGYVGRAELVPVERAGRSHERVRHCRIEGVEDATRNDSAAIVGELGRLLAPRAPSRGSIGAQAPVNAMVTPRVRQRARLLTLEAGSRCVICVAHAIAVELRRRSQAI